MSRRPLIIAAAVYAIGFVAAFGHCANGSYRRERADYLECRADPKALCLDNSTGTAGLTGFVAGIFWPLYLSWEIAELAS